MHSIMEEYAVLEAEIAEREMKKSQLRPHILKMLIDNGAKQMKTAVGSFSVSNRKVWSYPENVSEKVAELNDEAKAIKAKAESTGEATYEEVPGFRFTAIKL